MLWSSYESNCSSACLPAEEECFRTYLRSIFSEQQLRGQVLRRDAARVLHIFLMQILKLPDEDWGEYTRLKDLYDCRICANAIAQICVRSLMQPHSRYVFGSLLPFSEEEATETLRRLAEYF